MKKLMMQAVAVTAIAGAFLAPIAAHAEGMREERERHPRIAKAIHELEDAISYLEAAPHDFGGHKAAAVHASREAVAQLRMALEFREEQDAHHRH
jgi:hypothetical protein